MKVMYYGALLIKAILVVEATGNPPLKDYVYPPLSGSLAKLFFGVIWLFALIFSPSAYSQDRISSRTELQTALEKAVMCDVDGLTIFSNGLIGDTDGDSHPGSGPLGVKITGGEDTVYHLPRGVKVFGYEATEALFSARSVTTFFVKLRARSDQVRAISKTLKLATLPKGNPEGYGFFDQFEVRYIRKLPGSSDSPRDTVFSGTGKQENYVAIGCQNLSW